MMPSNTSISVIIPTRNRAHLLKRTIRSLQDQTYSDFEILVVDDGSTDETRDMITNMQDSRLRYLYQDPVGAAIARNRGAASARGSWLTFLDSDDTAKPAWLEHLHSAAIRTSAQIVFGGAEILDENSKRSQILLPHGLGPLLNGWTGFFNDGTFLLSVRLFEAVGGYAPELPANQHTELGIRIVDLCDQRDWSAACVFEPLVTWHQHTGPRIRNDAEAVLIGTEYILDNYETRLRRHLPDWVEYLAVAGTRALALGNRKKARHYLGRTLRYRPHFYKNLLRYLRTFFPWP